MTKNDPDQKTLAFNSLHGIPFVPLEPHCATLPPWSLSRCLSLFSRRHAKSGAGARLRPGARQMRCWPASPAGGTPDRAGDNGGLLAPPWGAVVSTRLGARVAGPRRGPARCGRTGYSQASYYTSLGLFVLPVPGLWFLIKRSVKSKVTDPSLRCAPLPSSVACLDLVCHVCQIGGCRLCKRHLSKRKGSWWRQTRWLERSCRSSHATISPSQTVGRSSRKLHASLCPAAVIHSLAMLFSLWNKTLLSLDLAMLCLDSTAKLTLSSHQSPS